MPTEIPEPEQLLAPILQSLSDGEQHLLQDTVSTIASELQLDEEALARRTTSGQHPVFYDRVVLGALGFKRSAPRRNSGVVDTR